MRAQARADTGIRLPAQDACRKDAEHPLTVSSRQGHGDNRHYGTKKPAISGGFFLYLSTMREGFRPRTSKPLHPVK